MGENDTRASAQCLCVRVCACVRACVFASVLDEERTNAEVDDVERTNGPGMIDDRSEGYEGLVRAEAEQPAGRFYESGERLASVSRNAFVRTERATR